MASDMRGSVDRYKRELIVNAAEELFFTKGFMQTSMTDIAQHLAVGKPTIYQYFKSKGELLSEVCNRTTEFAADIARLSLDQDSAPPDKIRRIVRELSLTVMENRFSLAVLFREVKHLPLEERTRLSRNYHEFNKFVSEILSEGVQNGDFRSADHTVVVHAISGAASWLFTWYQSDGRLSPEQIADEMAELAVGMIKAGEGKASAFPKTIADD